jgi:hypothetical protein
MNRHEIDHANLARLADKVEIEEARATDPTSTWAQRAAAEASLQALVGPRYRGELREHLKRSHGVALFDLWNSTEELTEIHDRAHEEAHDAVTVP